MKPSLKRRVSLVGRLLSAAFALSLLTGWVGPAIKAPPYFAALFELPALRALSQPVKVGDFSVAGVEPDWEGVTVIALRGSRMISPVKAHFGHYLADAVGKELARAERYAADSRLELSGVLLKNDMSVAVFKSRHSGEIEARFVLSVDGVVRYDKLIRAETSWEGVSYGAKAIEQGQLNYPLLVKDLLERLFSDPDFATAVKSSQNESP